MRRAISLIDRRDKNFVKGESVLDESIKNCALNTHNRSNYNGTNLSNLYVRTSNADPNLTGFKGLRQQRINQRKYPKQSLNNVSLQVLSKQVSASTLPHPSKLNHNQSFSSPNLQDLTVARRSEAAHLRPNMSKGSHDQIRLRKLLATWSRHSFLSTEFTVSDDQQKPNERHKYKSTSPSSLQSSQTNKQVKSPKNTQHDRALRPSSTTSASTRASPGRFKVSLGSSQLLMTPDPSQHKLTELRQLGPNHSTGFIQRPKGPSFSLKGDSAGIQIKGPLPVVPRTKNWKEPLVVEQTTEQTVRTGGVQLGDDESSLLSVRSIPYENIPGCSSSHVARLLGVTPSIEHKDSSPIKNLGPVKDLGKSRQSSRHLASLGSRGYLEPQAQLIVSPWTSKNQKGYFQDAESSSSETAVVETRFIQ